MPTLAWGVPRYISSCNKLCLNRSARIQFIACVTFSLYSVFVFKDLTVYCIASLVRILHPYMLVTVYSFNTDPLIVFIGSTGVCELW